MRLMLRPAALALFLLLTGCLGEGLVEPPSTGWSATLVPVTGEVMLEGRAVAVTEYRRTYGTVEISQATPEQQYSWEFRHGGCSGGGATVGSRAAYGSLLVDSQGAASAQVVVGEQLRSAGAYHAVVLDGTPERRVLACGELVRNVVEY